MEKFEIDEGKNLELFSNFANKTKDAFITLIENVKENIKKYDQAIIDTEKEIEDNEASCEKCETEITKMQEKIISIEDTIENVENTYKRMVDAYSSSSKEETKELYSEIIDGAKTNCEKDVEKNKAEIERLNSDIEAIKNNIIEFNKIIDKLKEDLNKYKLELSKYNKVLGYLERESDSSAREFEKIEANIIVAKEPKKVLKEESTSSVLEDNTLKEEVIVEETLPVKEEKEAIKKEEINFEDSLKQIYDLTGYKPKKEEPSEKIKPVESSSLEDLFKSVDEFDKLEDLTKSYDENDMSEWEKILNGADDVLNTAEPIKKEETVKQESDFNVVNQLLKPYGTDYSRLKSLVQDKITYKNGTSIPFDLTEEDVMNAINDVDGNDLKTMKIVGPEITLLRKIKSKKEGK